MSELSMSELAQLANTSYQKWGATRRKYASDVNKNLIYDSGNSTKYIAVVRDRRNNNVYVSHRGTKLADGLDDLHADASIVLGLEKTHSRFKEAQTHYDKLKEKYPDANFIFTSHSLGGTISRNLARENRADNVQAHIFNPGSAIGAVLDSKKQKKEGPEKSNIHTYHATSKNLGISDPISILSVAGLYGNENIHIIRGSSSNPHSLKNFIDYKSN